MRWVCADRNVKPTSFALWTAIQSDDVLAFAAGRLLLWTDPAPMPLDEAGAWACYLHNWRPGKPHPSTWPTAWANAKEPS